MTLTPGQPLLFDERTRGWAIRGGATDGRGGAAPRSGAPRLGEALPPASILSTRGCSADWNPAQKRPRWLAIPATSGEHAKGEAGDLFERSGNGWTIAATPRIRACRENHTKPETSRCADRPDGGWKIPTIAVGATQDPSNRRPAKPWRTARDSGETSRGRMEDRRGRGPDSRTDGDQAD